MTTQDPSPLDAFELRLLRELRAIVESTPAAPAGRADGPGDGPGHQPAGAPHRPGWPRHPGIRVAAAAAAAATAAGAYLASPLGTSPAFAVDAAANGDVRVQVVRLEGAEALEKVLADAGIRSDVTYPGQGKQCRPGRYTTPAREATESANAPDTPATGAIPAPRAGTMSAAVSSDGGQSLSFSAGMLKPGQTLVIESMWPDSGAWTLRVGVADGPIAPCIEVPYTGA